MGWPEFAWLTSGLLATRESLLCGYFAPPPKSDPELEEMEEG